jgi:hypothetical protein
MGDAEMCTGQIAPDGRRICKIHDVELVTQAVARTMGLTNDQPFLGQWVCPKSGSLLSFDAVSTALDDLNRE